MKKIISIAVLLLLCFSMTGVEAISLNTPDSVNGKITVKGLLDSKKSELPVTLQVFRPGFNGNIEALAESILSEVSVDLTETYANAAETSSKENGEFSFEFPISPDVTGSGYYTILVSSPGETLKKTGIYVVIEEDFEKALESLNGCSTATDVKTFFEKDNENHYASYLGLVSDEFNDLEDCGPVYIALADWINKNTAKKENIFLVINLFRKFTAICSLNEASSQEKALEIVNKYTVELGVADMRTYATFSDSYFNDAYRNEVIGALYGKSFPDYIAFENAFDSAVILRALHNLASWNDAYDKVISPNLDILTEIDKSEYLSSSTQSEPKKAITKKNFKTLSEMQKAFNSAIVTSKGNSGGSGGSSSGGSGGGKKYSVQPYSAPQSADLPFNDISGVSWAHESISSLYKSGIINGINEKEFAPDAEVTREQFVKMLVEGFKIKDNTAVCEFEDIEKGAWYEAYVATAYNLALINGKTSVEFGVGEKITREDMAVLAYRFLKYANSAPAESAIIFSDSENIELYAREAVGALNGAGIINGMGDGTFAPKKFATRAQAAKIIFSVLALAKQI